MQDAIVQFRDVEPWMHLVHDFLVGVIWFWVGWKVGRRRMKNKIMSDFEDMHDGDIDR